MELQRLGIELGVGGNGSIYLGKGNRIDSYLWMGDGGLEQEYQWEGGRHLKLSSILMII